jgi:outer membrane receptor protein involved in Fe transport
MRSYFKQSLLAVALFLTAFIAAAQTSSYSIKGVIVDENKHPLPGVNIALLVASNRTTVNSTVSTKEGHFSFQNLSHGNYVLQLSSVGYQTFTSKEVLTSEGKSEIILDTLQMVPLPKKLTEVVVTSKRPLVEAKPDRMIVNVEGSLVSTGSTVLEILERSPGVVVDKDGNISMQGKNGVQVTIDGKPTYLSPGDLANLLKSMQSDGVASIELITAPSAKYDAAGNAGIINIKTKRSRNTGVNGTLTAGLGYGNYTKSNGGLALNYRNQKLNLFGNYGYQYNKKDKTLNLQRVAVQNTIATDFVQDNKEVNQYHNHAVKLGADYNVSKKAIVGLLVQGTLNNERQYQDGLTSMGHQRETDSTLSSQTKAKQKLENYSYNLNYKQSLNTTGRELTVDIDYGQFRSRENTHYENLFFNKVGNMYKPVLYLRSLTPSDINIKSAKADYTHPISEMLRMEIGVKAAEVRTENTILIEQKEGATWNNDPRRSNEFEYNEKVYAGYISSSYQHKKLSYQGGLRLEHTRSEGISPTTGKEVLRTYSDLFPSVQVNYVHSANHNLGLAYSKRIQRPNYQTLNPFVYFLDQYGYVVGNPYLNPQYSHSLDLTYVFKGRYIVQLGATRINDVIAQAILPDTANKAVYETSENLDRQQMYRLTVNAPLTITKWWRSNTNVNGVYMSFQSDDLKGQVLDASQVFVLINSNHSFNFGKGFSGELVAKYTSPLVYGTLKLRSEYGFDLGIGKTILNKKGNVKLSMNDVLNTRQLKVSSVYPGLDYAIRQKMETRVARLTFTYRFGNSNIKSQRARATGVESEQGRLKTNEQ